MKLNHVDTYKKALVFLQKKESKKKGIKLLESIETKTDLATFDLAIEALNGNYTMEPKKMRSIFLKFARANNPIAFLNLGYCYDEGISFRRNRRKAFYFYKAAANAGLVQAELNVAIFFEKGIGTKTNKKKAFEFYKLAADKKNTEAINSLGWCFLNGQGTKKNYTQAMRLFKKAAKRNYPSSFTNIGYMYLNGLGIKKNKFLAKKYLEKGRSFGSSEASELLKYFL